MLDLRKQRNGREAFGFFLFWAALIMAASYWVAGLYANPAFDPADYRAAYRSVELYEIICAALSFALGYAVCLKKGMLENWLGMPKPEHKNAAQTAMYAAVLPPALWCLSTFLLTLFQVPESDLVIGFEFLIGASGAALAARAVMTPPQEKSRSG